MQDLDELEALAWELMGKHGLLEKGWKFEWDRAERRYGHCRYRDRVITISEKLALINEWDETRETILHEIAHALAPNHHHDAHWRAVALSIGSNGVRCYGEDEVVAVPGKWVGECPLCGHTTRKRKQPREKIACKQCCDDLNNGYFLDDAEFIWRKEA